MQETIENNPIHNNDIDINDAIKVILKKKILILSITSLISIISLICSLFIPDIYSSKSLLASIDKQESLSSSLSSFSGLSAIAGVSLPSETNSKTVEAIARIKSLDFFTEYFLPNIKLEDLMAVSNWSSEDNLLIYDKTIFDATSKKWIRNVNYPKKNIPSQQEAYKVYGDILSIFKDKETSFISISIDHKSPYIAKEWLEIILENINKKMRAEDIKAASQSVSFLNNKLETTNVNEIREVLIKLMGSEMQKLMLATSTDNYVFKILDFPYVPEEKSSPNRLLILVFGLLLGMVISFITVFLFYSREKNIS
ncbi:MAG: chain length determinant protein [Flavobacteriaceae bacterium]|nr:chain length determinant protein [Flavobacteriaceae bacterium]|tara:strand:- start:4252 stop:5184 length:933 start_codon:yes stop_codon:yes gene_type:complete